jgi:riboflavin kinase/FMN adenylyltransferase
MQVYRSLSEKFDIKNAVITIGTFDGVHIGHKAIIDKVKNLAHETDGNAVIITFDPHPRKVINPDDTSLRLLTTVEEKLHLLEKNGVDAAVVVPFSRSFSDQSAEDYILDFLVSNFHPKHIVIGYDHRFGRDRRGDYNMLASYQESCEFKLSEISKQTLDDITISSTKIRQALINGKVAEANELLGYRYSLSGLVIKGFQNGRKIGYPTANISINDIDKLVPSSGIYAVMVEIGEETYNGMLSIGYNPTFLGTKLSIEVNIIDFDKDIYGENITIEFVDFIRHEKKFDTVEDLILAIDRDKEVITALLGK